MFISTIVSVQTFFFIIHALHLSLTQEVPFADCIWSWDKIPESYHVKNLLYSILYDDPQKMYQVWRYITTAFIHTDIIRLSQCVFVEISIGFPLELEYGAFRVAMIYFAGQLSGSLYSKIFDEKLYEPDAIPAVYALISTQLILLFMKWHSNFF